MLAIFRQAILIGTDHRALVLLLVILISITDASKCKKGEYFEIAIQRCFPCRDKCQPDDIPKLCPQSCKGWNVTTPSPKCHDGYYHWSDAVGRCIQCSTTCSNVGEEKCPLECAGWNKENKPSHTNMTKGSNPKNSWPKGQTADDDERPQLSWLYAIGICMGVVFLLGGTVAFGKWKNRQRLLGGHQQEGDIEMREPLTDPANNPAEIQAPRDNQDNEERNETAANNADIIGGNEERVEIGEDAHGASPTPPIQSTDAGDGRSCVLHMREDIP